MKSKKTWIVGSLVGACLGLLSGTALADVEIEGAWPDDAPKISLHLANAAPSDAVREVAKKAGWSVVLRGDFDHGRAVSLDVEETSPKDVLESILEDGSFVARRRGEGGKILEIVSKGDAPAAAKSVESNGEKATTPAKPAEEASPDAAGSARRGSDRHVFGQSLRIEKSETVGDVSVTGGSVDVYGTLDGDLVVTGGSATVHDGGHVTGDAHAIGGSIRIEKGGRIDGDGKVIGGVFWKDDGAIVGGDVSTVASNDASSDDDASLTAWQRWTRKVPHVFSNFAFLFVLGALFVAAAPDRMRRLRTAFAEKPVASIAHGLLGLLAFAVGFVVLCITVIGIPFAVILALVGVFALIGALAATLTTVGAAVFGHRTQNVYAHLAIGCAMFALSALVPWLGGWLQFAAVLAAIGVLVTTRLAGLWLRKNTAMAASPSDVPYR